MSYQNPSLSQRIDITKLNELLSSLGLVKSRSLFWVGFGKRFSERVKISDNTLTIDGVGLSEWDSKQVPKDTWWSSWNWFWRLLSSFRFWRRDLGLRLYAQLRLIQHNLPNELKAAGLVQRSALDENIQNMFLDYEQLREQYGKWAVPAFSYDSIQCQQRSSFSSSTSSDHGDLDEPLPGAQSRSSLEGAAPNIIPEQKSSITLRDAQMLLQMHLYIINMTVVKQLILGKPPYEKAWDLKASEKLLDDFIEYLKRRVSEGDKKELAKIKAVSQQLKDGTEKKKGMDGELYRADILSSDKSKERTSSDDLVLFNIETKHRDAWVNPFFLLMQKQIKVCFDTFEKEESTGNSQYPDIKEVDSWIEEARKQEETKETPAISLSHEIKPYECFLFFLRNSPYDQLPAHDALWNDEKVLKEAVVQILQENVSEDIRSFLSEKGYEFFHGKVDLVWNESLQLKRQISEYASSIAREVYRELGRPSMERLGLSQKLKVIGQEEGLLDLYKRRLACSWRFDQKIQQATGSFSHLNSILKTLKGLDEKLSARFGLFLEKASGVIHKNLQSTVENLLLNNQKKRLPILLVYFVVYLESLQGVSYAFSKGKNPKRVLLALFHPDKQRIKSGHFKAKFLRSSYDSVTLDLFQSAQKMTVNNKAKDIEPSSSSRDIEIQEPDWTVFYFLKDFFCNHLKSCSVKDAEDLTSWHLDWISIQHFLYQAQQCPPYQTIPMLKNLFVEYIAFLEKNGFEEVQDLKNAVMTLKTS